jgi:hypothetical protein
MFSYQPGNNISIPLARLFERVEILFCDQRYENFLGWLLLYFFHIYFNRYFDRYVQCDKYGNFYRYVQFNKYGDFYRYVQFNKYGDFYRYVQFKPLTFLAIRDKKYFMLFYLKYITASQKIRF